MTVLAAIVSSLLFCTASSTNSAVSTELFAIWANVTASSAIFAVVTASSSIDAFAMMLFSLAAVTVSPSANDWVVLKPAI